MRLLLVDNYDSFTYNLAHLFGELGAEVVVRRNDAITPDEADELAPSHLVVSPGPGPARGRGRVDSRSSSASPAACRRSASASATRRSCRCFGGEVGQARELVHGKATTVAHDGRGIFAGLPEDFLAGRYHSLARRRCPTASRCRRRRRTAR